MITGNDGSGQELNAERTESDILLSNHIANHSAKIKEKRERGWGAETEDVGGRKYTLVKGWVLEHYD